MNEYELLTSTNEYSIFLRKINSKYSKLNYLNCITAAYLLMRVGSDNSVEILRKLKLPYDKINPENVAKLRAYILSYKTRLQIEAITQTENKEKTTYEKVIAMLELALGRSVEENITLAKYVSLIKALEEKTKMHKNVRPNRN